MQSQKAEFWQSHSLKFLEMAFRTDRQETLQKPDGYGMKARSCGDTVEFYLMVNDDRIRFISYRLRSVFGPRPMYSLMSVWRESKLWRSMNPDRLYLTKMNNDGNIVQHMSTE